MESKRITNTVVLSDSILVGKSPQDIKQEYSVDILGVKEKFKGEQYFTVSGEDEKVNKFINKCLLKKK